ncbi:glycoside hydrolase family 16 protein, partial [Saccharata proteae CBS 121410]
MRYSSTAAAAFAAAALPLAFAQTYSNCNPMNASQFPCTPDVGLDTSSFTSDFTQGSSANTSWSYVAESVNYASDGAEFTIAQRGQAPTIETDFSIFYGKVSVTMKAAKGQGIISSIVLQSDDLDEIDWEFLGGDNANVQTNYFGKGNTTTYDRGLGVAVSTPQDTSHTYTVDWTKESVKWQIDGTTVRTLNYADAVGGANFPQTPMNIRLGIWAGGDPDNSYWTIVWAGGNTTYSAEAGMPWTMLVEKVEITNYNPAEGYNYTDTSGSSDSIKLLGDYTAPTMTGAAAGNTGAAGIGAGAHSGDSSAAATSTATPADSATGSSPDASYTGVPVPAGTSTPSSANGSGSGSGSGSSDSPSATSVAAGDSSSSSSSSNSSAEV